MYKENGSQIGVPSPSRKKLVESADKWALFFLFPKFGSRSKFKSNTIGTCDVRNPMFTLKGLDSLLSTVQMPAGIPVGTLAIGSGGAKNAALLAIAILANSRPELKKKLRLFRQDQTGKVLKEKLGSRN